ncbi:hypothetical protein BH10PLA2_BH10PLA2_08510 [soil metagenome]
MTAPQEPEYDLAEILVSLPGPQRRRSPTPYRYRLVYINPEKHAGCQRQWEVLGGRQPYQIALEKDPRGNLHLHCTCADAIYRKDNEGRFCKHVLGLLEIGKRPGQIVENLEPRSRKGA